MKMLDFDNTERIHTAGHSSKGDQPKWESGGSWYKADYAGYEALSEIIVSRLLEKSNVNDFVLYRPVRIRYKEKEYAGRESANFRAKDEQLIPLERLHRAYRGAGLARTLGKFQTAAERIKYTVDFVEHFTGLSGVGRYFAMLLELDAFFLNEDRHTNNIAVIRNETTLAFRLCPVFDNGLALLSDVHDYPAGSDIYACIGRVRAKPFAEDFEEQVCAAEELYGSPLKFGFTRKDVSQILGELTQLYPPDILSRVEHVICEQMRKYPIYFR